MMKVLNSYKAKAVMEGAGVTVNRVFGHSETSIFDPFLMLDYFDNASLGDSPGFPWHPHKGIETISYILHGRIEHQDSIGNKGVISDGELQWMSAGRGIMHQEMPKPSPRMQGFQFWVNLAANQKLKEPEYGFIFADKKVTIKEEGVLVNLIAGTFMGETGPIDKSDIGVSMYHVIMEAGQSFTLHRDEDKNGFIFVYEGKGHIEETNLEALTAYTLASGDIQISSDQELSFIYAEGRPLNEPIAWYGPVVMNTQEEIRQTFRDIENGTF